MASRTWKHGLLLGFVGFSLAAGCVVKSGDDDDDLGEAGDSSGGTDTGGSSTGGRGGSATGGSSTGGRGGSATGGTATGGSSTGGSATGGSSTGGTGGTEPEYECDPSNGSELANTPFPDCHADESDTCGKCLEMNCCEETRICYGYNPGNVCGYGGTDLDGDDVLDGEFACFVDCALSYVEENDVLDETGKDECGTRCATSECGTIIGNATNALIACAEDHCEDKCWPAP